MPPFRAKVFYRNGYKSVKDISSCEISRAAQILRYMVPHEQEPCLTRSNTFNSIGYSTPAALFSQLPAGTQQTQSRNTLDVYNGALENLASSIINKAREIVNKNTTDIINK